MRNLFGLRIDLGEGEGPVVAVFSLEDKAVEHARLYSAKTGIQLKKFVIFETRLDPEGTCPSNVPLEGTYRFIEV